MSYDYRVTGRFLRRDVEERVHGFHAVPRGTILPRRFALGAIALRTPEPAIVEQRPAPRGRQPRRRPGARASRSTATPA